MKISVITPSLRREMLGVVEKCLKRQIFKDFEWFIVAPFGYIPTGEPFLVCCSLPEPNKRENDYYNLNKAWNAAFKEAHGELLISIVDGLWFPPDTLEKLWDHYKANPKAIVGTIGHQYDRIENGKPEHMVWRDPRMRIDQGSFYQTLPTEVEWTIASIPRKAIFEAGGIDEKWDHFAALSEKETNVRMEKLGYTLWLDQAIEYRAIYHPRLSEEWDKKYQEGSVFYQQCIQEILAGKRLRLDFLNNSNP